MFIFCSSAQVIPGILVVFIGVFGCNIEMALLVWFIAVTLITAAYAGAMANIVDIAPNYAGIIHIFFFFIIYNMNLLLTIILYFLFCRSRISIRSNYPHDSKFFISYGSRSAYPRQREYFFNCSLYKPEIKIKKFNF